MTAVERLAAEFPHPTGPPARKVGQAWLTWLQQSRGRQAITVYQYAGKMDSFFEWIENVPLGSVTVADMEAWLGRERQGRAKGARGAPATVSKEVSMLRGLFGFAVARGHIAHDPTALLHAPKVSNSNPSPVPDETWRQQWVANLSDEARAFLGLGYYCGLRRSELVSVGVGHFDLKRERIVKFPRKGGGDDVLDFGEVFGVVHEGLGELCEPDNFLSAVHTHVKASKDRLFSWGPGRHTDPQLVYRRVWGYQKAAGLARGTFTPHMLRHSFVTNLLRCGVPIHLVSVLANHSSVSVTMRYAKLGGADLRDWRRSNRALKGDFSRFANSE